jgi:hypothetical protein
MGDHQRRHRGGGGGFGEDRISGLPDALLHEILVRLRSASAAARTSVLSRRWCHLWAHLPELRLVALPSREAAPASFIDTVDAALGGYLAPTLEHLGVSHHVTDIQGRDLRISPARIAPWLHFAAAHVVGELNLYLRVPQTFGASTPEIVWDEEAAVLELPVCERTKRIELFLQYAYTHWLRPQASGLFAVLTFLKINGYVRMEGRDLTALVSTQCPCLRDLDLFIKLIDNFDVLIHSNSLHTLVLRVLETRRLEVVAPRLEEFTIWSPLAAGDPSGILAFSRGEKPARKLAMGQITVAFGSLRSEGRTARSTSFPRGAAPRLETPGTVPLVGRSIFRREEARTEEALRRRRPSSLRHEEALRRRCWP